MAKIKGDEYVKFVTEQFVQYIETPKAERKQTRTSARAQREPWLTRWFGWGPMSLMLWWRGITHRQR
ncbi:YqzE family protein [Paenibacillus arenilitoris]|uniref:YqzE family protein n=1 Tax=Paenibacillus arenilitoris TaxID=2772299 RepID=A0A927H763_9BACL|nr:YqzE family protein [Paenibacillus arenilitoris]MBD2870212.1 YqzE family protein [Paenibacillus arenilitoris]